MLNFLFVLLSGMKKIQKEESCKKSVQITQLDEQREVKYWYDKIESIKSTISMANGDRPELWIQRQNLQDLYRQIILSDVDFTIDKKLEQDLWNYVFKLQINYFQSQIKKESSSSSTGVGSSMGCNSGSSVQSASSCLSVLQQKKLEAQANMSFFLEAARGFYTKLLEDIIFKYGLNNSHEFEDMLPFCQSCPSLFDKIDSFNKTKSFHRGKEKQILYICQHILTHLGDIARYAIQFQQAKNYYYHAIKLVPYLGHPYNQLGILFETSRTNQLSTVFYYIRSIAVRYTFPLASNNLDNFFYKLVEIPLTRYNPSNVANNIVKLSHKDLLTLYLQINAVIYFSKLSKHQRIVNTFKLSTYIDLFKSSFETYMNTSIQRDKLDSIQLLQVIVILIYIVSIKNEANTNNQNAIELFAFMIEQFIGLYKQNSDLVLPSLYVSFSFIEKFDSDSTSLIKTNKLWPTNKSTQLTVDMLNDLNDKWKQSNRLKYLKEAFISEYPLNEDKMLDSFLPLNQSFEALSRKKTSFKNLSLIEDDDENLLRMNRLVVCLKRLLEAQGTAANSDCFILVNKIEKLDTDIADNNEQFSFSINSLKCSTSETLEKNKVEIKTSPESNQQQVVRKKRHNVAISSITKESLLFATGSSNSSTKQLTATSSQVVPPVTTSSSSSSPSPLTLSSSSSTNSNEKSKTININMNQINPQPNPINKASSLQTSSSFFPSASSSFRQLNQPSAQSNNSYLINYNFNKNESLNPSKPTSTNSSNTVFPSFLPTLDQSMTKHVLNNKTDAPITNQFHKKIQPAEQNTFLLQQQQQQQRLNANFNFTNNTPLISNLWPSDALASNQNDLKYLWSNEKDFKSTNLGENESLTSINEFLIQQLLVNNTNSTTSINGEQLSFSGSNSIRQQNDSMNLDNKNSLWSFPFQQDFKKQ